MNFDPCESSSSIKICTNPIAVQDSNNLAIKAFIINCVVNGNNYYYFHPHLDYLEDSGDLKNSLIAFCTLISNYTVFNFDGDLLSNSKTELTNLNDFINSLSTNGEFQSEQGLIETLPNLMWITKEQEKYQYINSWDSLYSVLREQISQEESGNIDALEYIPEKDLFALPEISSLTPFCEGIQDIQQKLLSETHPVRLGGY